MTDEEIDLCHVIRMARVVRRSIACFGKYSDACCLVCRCFMGQGAQAAFSDCWQLLLLAF
jgi:hypothetical protein